MRVGLIVYALDRPITGIGRYTLELARALCASNEDLELTLLTAGRSPGPLAGEGFRWVSLPGCHLMPGLVTIGNVVIRLAAQRLRLDVVHDPTGVTPFLFGLGPTQAVVTVHDVFAWSCPGTSSLLDTIIYRKWLPRALPRAEAVITVSDHSQKEIKHHLGISSSRLSVIPYGVSPRFSPRPLKEVRKRLRDRFELDGPYILYVGALTIRKNIERALEAYASITAEFPLHRFVLAGPRTWKQTPVDELVSSQGIAEKILTTGPLTDADLPILYSGADLFVFPSLYEGFGLPPLEAMACGTPVVCSDVSSLPEVVGDAAIKIDPYNVAALAEAMRQVLGDTALQEELRQRGLARAARFTWEHTARKTVEVYREVCGLPRS